MKNLLLLLLGIMFSTHAFSQISFEKGYYINNSDKKIECFIKNVGWRNNPSQFEYKLSLDGDKKKEKIETVKEFGVLNDFKYVRSDVKIDRSSSDMNSLSWESRPVFKEETLFLKLIFEGKANLYFYEDGNIKRYFYNVDNNEIKPLIYKMYRSDNNTVGKNNQFRQQLWNDLKCPKIKLSNIERVEYYKKDLIDFFNEYNQCHGAELVAKEKKKKKDVINLSLRPRLRLSSTDIKNSDFFGSREVNFGTNLGFGFGIEAEFILPFNKNKWTVIIEPTYQYIKTEKATNRDNIPGEKTTSTLKYNSIEFPIGARYYFFLNDNSKIFINVMAVFDLSFNSSISSVRVDNTPLDPLEISTVFNIASGVGYKLNDKYSIELRYQSNRNLLLNYANLKTKHSTFEVIFGYTLF